ncbi:MAG: glycoside hydrolase family 3 protein [Cyclobacteriaceae bacterium]|nr:glycoside hydrolase family 3 protein [Cyclobacteriaceae bacterium]
MKNIKHVIIFLLFAGSLQAQNKDMMDVKIGQMLLIGFPKAEVDAKVLEDIKSGKVGTIIIFEKNIPKGPSSFAALKKIIWTYQKAAPIPLLISIDQEGGKVNRLKEKYGFTKSLTAQDMGKAKTLDSVRFYSEATAATLAGLGINVNFAPVVDVAVNPANPVIVKSGRSFSASPDSVALYAEEFIKPHRKFGVNTVLKHFPGHGSSMEDTHFGVADVTKSWTASELIPYQKLINAGIVDAVMTAHIVNKQLDPKGYPGTLSSRIIDSLLRKQLHYEGVVFSDDMQMQAITKQYGLEESIKLAINAGVDILCFANNVPGSEDRTVSVVHAIIRKLVDSGQIKPERIDESFNRILKLKSKIGSSPEEFLRRELDATRLELVNLKKAPEIKQETKIKTEEGKPVVEPQEEDSKSKKKKKRS